MPKARWLMEQHLGRRLAHTEHVHHINGDPMDDRIENLEILPEGSHHAHHTGSGMAHRQAKLSDDQVRDIRTRARNGEEQRPIAKAFGVHQSTVWSIVNRDTWKHLP